MMHSTLSRNLKINRNQLGFLTNIPLELMCDVILLQLNLRD